MAEHIPLRKRPLSERIANAEEIARQNIAAAFGVQEFAEAAGLSRSRFSVAYQSYRGRSAGTFLRTLRMERAVELLKTTNQPVATVGRMVGYPEPTGFGRAFRRHTGLSPSRFRATARKANVIEGTDVIEGAARETPPSEARTIEAPPPQSTVRATLRDENSGLIEVPHMAPPPKFAAS